MARADPRCGSTHLMVLLLAFVFFTGSAWAHDFTAGRISIEHPWLRMPPPGAKSAGAYLRIRNDSSEDVALQSVQSELAASSSLHETTMVDGVARMRELTDGLEVGANEAVTLEPGGIHIMFTDLQRKLSVGELIPATVVFANGEQLEVSFKVEPIGFATDYRPHEAQ